MNKEFDIVVHGATGFTGRLVVEYLMARYPQGAGATVRWAMGGRSAEKLAAVRDEIGAPRDTPLVVTDGTDVASLRALTDRTRLVLTTVGPYQLYGNELVAACAASGTDYVDLCGEPVWMRDMIDAHEAQAKASGADHHHRHLQNLAAGDLGRGTVVELRIGIGLQQLCGVERDELEGLRRLDPAIGIHEQNKNV